MSDTEDDAATAAATAAAAAAAATATAAAPSTAASRRAAIGIEMQELADADKADVLDIGANDAKTVAPRDLMSPINADLMPHAGDITILDLWDGRTSTFVSYTRALKAAISSGRLGYYAEFSCEWLGLHPCQALGFPVTINAGYKALVKARCNQLNRFRESALAQGKRSLFATILSSLDTATRDQVCADGVDSLECPDQLWEAIRTHARGPFAKTTGAALMAKFFSTAWDSSADTFVNQVDFNFRAMNELVQTSDALAESGYTVTIPAALVKMVAIMPDGLRIHERIYNDYDTLTKLRDEMRRDAARLDSSAAQGLKSFAVHTSALEAMRAEIAELKRECRRQPDKRGGNGRDKGERTQFTKSQLMDPDFRPPSGTPFPFKHFCSVHGHSTTHSDAGCFVLHPELKPASD